MNFFELTQQTSTIGHCSETLHYSETTANPSSQLSIQLNQQIIVSSNQLINWISLYMARSIWFLITASSASLERSLSASRVQTQQMIPITRLSSFKINSINPSRGRSCESRRISKREDLSSCSSRCFSSRRQTDSCRRWLKQNINKSKIRNWRFESFFSGTSVTCVVSPKGRHTRVMWFRRCTIIIDSSSIDRHKMLPNQISKLTCFPTLFIFAC